MKTICLLRDYKREKQEQPTELWKRLVWMAAELLKTAERERNTAHKAHERIEDKRQMMLDI